MAGWHKVSLSCLMLILLPLSTQQNPRIKRQGRESCTTPRNVAGVCVNIKECPLHLEYLVNQRKEPGVLRYLQDAVCYKQGSQVVTCCPVERSVNFDNDVSDCQTPNQTSGRCMNIRRCPSLVNLLTRQKEPGVTDYLRNSLCGFENKDPKVCCPLTQPNNNNNQNNQNNNQQQQNTESDNTLPGTNACGLSDVANNRVVNGRPANLGSWPWMTALGYSSTKKSLEWLCGGSLINHRYVVTAAHCVTNIGRKKLYLARLGDLNLDDEVQDRASPIDIPIEKSFAHENYNANLHTVDIALVRLKDRVEYTKLIRPICIPTPGIFDDDLSGYSPFVIGWGATSYRGPSTTALQEAQIDITDEDSCYNSYKNIKGATIDNRVICAMSPLGKDACQGDSGGPLILPKQSRSVNFYLIGVVSYGYKCAEPGYPGIYTKVSLYSDWIKRNMN